MIYDKADYGFFIGSLVNFNKCKIVVELGVAGGDTTDFLCHAVKNVNGHIYGFDMWNVHGLWNQFPTSSSKQYVENKLKNFGHLNFTLTQINTKTKEFKDKLNELCPVIDLAFIDACHSYEGIKNDFDAIYPHMTHDGIVVFHDTTVIDGCREFIIDLRDKLNDGTFDIMDFTYGFGPRRCALTVLKKRSFNHGVMIDEICGSPSTPEEIYKKENDWLNSELLKYKK
jgi:hypothetical protein